MSFRNKPIIYDKNEVFYLIDDNCRKTLCNLFDCLGNISSYNDYYCFLKKYPKFYSFNSCKSSKSLKIKLIQDEYILIILDKDSNSIKLPSERHYVIFFEKYNNIKIKNKLDNLETPINITENTLDTINKPIDITENTLDTINKPIDITENTLDTINKPIDITENTLDTINKPIDITENTLDTINKPIDITENTLDTINKPIDITENTLDTINKPINITENTLDTINKPINITENTLDTINKPIDITENTLDTINVLEESQEIKISKIPSMIEDYLENNNSSTIVKELFEKYNQNKETKPQEEQKPTYVNPIWKLFGW